MAFTQGTDPFTLRALLLTQLSPIISVNTSPNAATLLPLSLLSLYSSSFSSVSITNSSLLTKTHNSFSVRFTLCLIDLLHQESEGFRGLENVLDCYRGGNGSTRGVKGGNGGNGGGIGGDKSAGKVSDGGDPGVGNFGHDSGADNGGSGIDNTGSIESGSGADNTTGAVSSVSQVPDSGVSDISENSGDFGSRGDSDEAVSGVESNVSGYVASTGTVSAAGKINRRVEGGGSGDSDLGGKITEKKVHDDLKGAKNSLGEGLVFGSLNNDSGDKNEPNLTLEGVKKGANLSNTLLKITEKSSNRVGTKSNLTSSSSSTDLYQTFFQKVITSNNIVPFDTFNHPVCQLFVISFSHDTLLDLRQSIVSFRNHQFPKFFQIDDLLIHVFILYDEVNRDEVIILQNQIMSQLNISSSIIPLSSDPETMKVSFNQVDQRENNSTNHALISKDVSDSDHSFTISKSFDLTLKQKVHEFISKHLILHMQSKIRIWDDQILQPKKSITTRFFLVSKKIFSRDSPLTSDHREHYNQQEGYYYKSSPEQTIRKLADWSIILKDFKYAYSTYDLIKKDYTNDKAWAYVASSQEMCVVSLLLTQTQPNQTLPDKNTLRKIKHDIIEPYIDNLSYTFTSRLDLRSNTIKALMTTAELLLCMSNYFRIHQWWIDLIEKYILKCISELNQHLTKNSQVINATLYERLGYSYGNNILVDSSLIDFEKEIGTFEPAPSLDPRKSDETIKTVDETTEEDNSHINPHKLFPPLNTKISGLTRFRKSALWYLLSIKEWLKLENYYRVEKLLQNIKLVYNIQDFDPEKHWYDREDLILGFAKLKLQEYHNQVNN